MDKLQGKIVILISTFFSNVLFKGYLQHEPH